MPALNSPVRLPFVVNGNFVSLGHISLNSERFCDRSHLICGLLLSVGRCAVRLENPEAVRTRTARSTEREATPPSRESADEEARLRKLYDLKILDTPRDERFDRLVRLAATHFGTPMARVTFVDRNRTWYKACVGPQAVESPRNVSLCAHTVISGEVLVSRDMSKDPRFCDSPQVAGAPKLRFYAGAPIILEDGTRVGSLCVVDTKPRPEFSDQDSAFLADLTQIAVHELELHRQAVSRQNSLNDAKRQLIIARSVKDRFMGVISHELKTPLNHILGFGRILAGQQLGPLGSDSYAELSRDLVQSAEHLEGLVDRVLNYTSAELSELRLSETVVATHVVMAKCQELVRTRALESGIDIRLSIDPDAPLEVIGDEVQLTEAIEQVLDNAIAFSPAGETVEFHAFRHGSGGLCFRVTDQGPGIDPDRIAQMMNAFTQGEIGSSRSHDGMGLGLAVSRTIMELHDGGITLSNRPNAGVNAELSLPAVRNH